MLARTADSLYWMNRYMERVDVILRTLRNGFIASYDINTLEIFSWDAILNIFSSLPEDRLKEIAKDPNDVLVLLAKEDEDNSLVELVTRARENARGAQDFLTKEVWESINQMYHSIQNLDAGALISSGTQMDFLVSQINESLVYYGVFENTMPRGQGWNFMNLGRFIERCIQTLNFADIKYRDLDYSSGESNHILYWKNMLLNLSGYELYLKTYRSGNHAENVIDMVFFNKDFPRSILYTLNKVQFYLLNILRDNDNINNPLIRRKAGMLHAKIAYGDLESMEQKGVSNFIAELKTDLFELTQLIGQSFFSYY
ncbi:MAG: alpha-E domain-containing protein [Niabella sp.]